MFKYTNYLQNYKKNAIIGPFFKWMEAVFELIVPLIMASMIDKGIANGDKSYVFLCGGILAVLGGVGLFFSLICQKNASIASQGFGTNLRNAMFEHVNRLSYLQLDRVGLSTIKTRITADVNRMQLAVAMFLRLMVRSPFLIAGAIVMTLLINIKIALIMLAFCVVVGISLYIIMKKSVPHLRRSQKSLEDLSAIVGENLTGARDIRALCRQDDEQQRFKKGADKWYKSSMSAGRVTSLLNPLTLVLINLGIAVILWQSGGLVNTGKLSQGQIVAVVNYMLQILNSMVVFATVINIFSASHASSLRVQEILDIQPEDFIPAHTSVLSETNLTHEHTSDAADGEYAVSLKNVDFSYHKSDCCALKDISFSVKRGESLGIIGGTGSGKTTLVNLLAGFYRADRGSVRILGRDVLEGAGGRVTVAPQKAVLFSGTVADNLRWGKENAGQEEMEAALKIAEAYGFIAKKGGLEAKVLQGGGNFSGGQRQRLNIARAVISKPDILILDDSFSALDYATDLKIRKALKKLNCTVIYVSQRVSTIKNCDNILVMENGRITDRGTDRQLYKNGGLYTQICDLQDVHES